MHLTESQQHSSELISQHLKGKEQLITEILSIDNLKAECQRLSVIESLIPGGSLELHFDMILNKSVTDYHRNMATGRNTLLEGISKLNLQKVLVAIENKLNEQNIASAMSTKDLMDLGKSLKSIGNMYGGSSPSKSGKTGEISTASVTPKNTEQAETEITTAVADSGDKQGVLSGLLTGLWDALTEGGSYIGIFHLLLDAVGLFGDILYPVGLVADLLNAAIYFSRAAFDHNKEKKGELLVLGFISVIAGLVPLGGDILKAAKPAIRPLTRVLVATMRSGKAGELALMKVGKANRGIVVKTLRFMAKHAATAFGKASKLFVKLFDGITKMVSIVPFIGKPLSKVFARFGAVLTKASEKVLLFAKNFDVVEKSVIKYNVMLAMRSIDDVVKSGGYLKYSKSGKKITAISANGYLLSKFPSKYLSDPKIWKNGYPGLYRIARSTDQLVNLANFKGAPLKTMKGLSMKYMGKITKSSLKAGKFIAFVSKIVIKLVMNSEQLTDPTFSDSDKDVMTNVAFNGFVNDLITKEKAEKDAIYLPSVMLDSRDEETYDAVTDYLNNIAKQYGMPSIQKAVVAKTPIEEVDDEFKNLWKQMAAGEAKWSEDGKSLIKTNNESLYFVKSREDFLNS